MVPYDSQNQLTTFYEKGSLFGKNTSSQSETTIRPSEQRPSQFEEHMRQLRNQPGEPGGETSLKVSSSEDFKPPLPKRLNRHERSVVTQLKNHTNYYRQSPQVYKVSILKKTGSPTGGNGQLTPDEAATLIQAAFRLAMLDSQISGISVG